MSKCTKCGTNFVGTPENPPLPGLCRYCAIDNLNEVLAKVYAVASGENQVADDDTGGMKWIADLVRPYVQKDNSWRNRYASQIHL